MLALLREDIDVGVAVNVNVSPLFEVDKLIDDALEEEATKS
jgi:hypothetical protein